LSFRSAAEESAFAPVFAFWLSSEGNLLFCCHPSAKREDLVLLLALALASKKVFCVFSPKTACQAPKPPKSLKQKEIDLAC
jgi:hypothetical protein